MWSPRHEAERGPALSLVGNLADLGLGDIFQIVSLSRRSGTLQLTTPVESGEIVFRAGKVVAAYRTNARVSVGEGLLEAGVLSPTTYQDMLAAQKAGRRAPELFSSLGVDRDALNNALDNILKQVIYDMFEWTEGTFSFVLEDTPDIWRGFALEGQRAVTEAGLNPQFLAIEGARLRDERTKEDTLATFLMKAQPEAQPRPASGLKVQEIAAKLRTAAELDSRPQDAAAAVTSPPADKVIPFPADRVRTRYPAAAPAPALIAEAPPAAPQAPGGSPQTPATRGTAGDEKTPSATYPSPESGAPPVPEATPTPAAAAAGDLARSRLLAIDDDPQVTRYIQDAFETHFTAITTADTVKEALAEVEADPADLVIASDLIIARSDGRGILGGIEILENVRQKWPAMPVVLFTDYQNEEAEARAKALGALAVLVKPRKAQVQAAGKEGRAVVQSFLTRLGEMLSPYYGTAHAPAPAQPPGGEVAPAATYATSAAPPASMAQSPAAFYPAPTSYAAAPPASTEGIATGVAAPPAETGPRRSQTPFDLSREISREMDELGRTLESELPPPLISAGEMAVLRSMLAELIDPANRDTVTLLVLRFASHLVERAGLFLATRRFFVGLGGFSVDEPSALFVGRVRRIQVPVDTESVFARVSRFRSMIRAPLKACEGNRLLIDGLGGVWPKDETVAAPLISGDRVAAILFGDNPSGKPLGPTDSLEIFLQQAGLAMDRALLERKLEDSRRQRGGPE